MEILTYLRLVFTSWFGVIGALSTLAWLIEIVRAKPAPRLSLRWLAVFAVVCITVAQFLAWDGQLSAATATDDLVSQLQRSSEEKDRQIIELTSDLRRLTVPAAPRLAVFPITYDQRPGVPVMAYVLTTNVERSPVDMIVECDSPLDGVNYDILTETGAGISQEYDRPLSPTRHQFTILSPPWPVSAPLKATVFFKRPVDRMPSCSFTA